MIEIEFSALSRLCLNRRIPTIEQLAAEFLAIMSDRSLKGIRINWQFSIDAFRHKLHARYSIVNQLNSKFNQD